MSCKHNKNREGEDTLNRSNERFYSSSSKLVHTYIQTHIHTHYNGTVVSTTWNTNWKKIFSRSELHGNPSNSRVWEKIIAYLMNFFHDWHQ